jgi:glycosyltransferase involved in cell wall biosynthesis
MKSLDSMLTTISIITPSYNQASFLPECLESVCAQTYPAIEHFVYDPGSSDGSRDISLGYANVRLFAEDDDGQSDAVNKGFAAVSGDVVGWLNSDDAYYDPNVFQAVIDRFNQPDQPEIVYGRGIYIDAQGEKLRDAYTNVNPDSFSWRLQKEVGILQPTVFFRRDIFDRVGVLRKNLDFCMDYEFWIRCMQAGLKFIFLDAYTARARYYKSNKTFGRRDESFREICDMLIEKFGYVHYQWLQRYAEYLSMGHDGILNTADQPDDASNEKYDETLNRLLRAYNTSALTWAALKQGAPRDRARRGTLKEMRERGIRQSTPCRDIPLDREKEDGHICYTVGPKRWAFDAAWRRGQIASSHKFLESEIKNRKNDVCIIIGNGPSLREVNPDNLDGQDIIVSNYAYLNEELFKRAKYLTVANYLVAEQGLQYFNQMETVEKIFPYWLGYCVNASENMHFVNSVGRAEFSTDMFENMSWRHTVTFFNLHLAYGLGYKKVIMTGFDHYYKQAISLQEADIVHTGEADENHFDAKYFQNKNWQAADVNNMEAMYLLAKRAYEKDGREIINCTVGGHLELFRRGDLKEELASH